MGTALKSAKPSSRKHELHTDDIKIEQASPVSERGDEQAADIHQSSIFVDKAMHPGLPKAYLEELRFNEEPVTVMFTPAQERFAAPFVDAAVMGIGLEAMSEDGRWLQLHQVPVNMEVTIKRKYVEVFARCKHTDVRAFARGVPSDGSEPVNDTLRSTNLKFPFVLIEDKNPRGREWLMKIVTGRV
jgi:hypothetical protein